MYKLFYMELYSFWPKRTQLPLYLILAMLGCAYDLYCLFTVKFIIKKIIASNIKRIALN